MQNTWLWIVGIVVVVVGGFIWWQSSQGTAPSVELTPTTSETVNTVPSSPADTASTDTTTNTTNETNTTTGTNDTSPSTPTSATVTYTDSGFSPSSVTIKKGGTVKFVDQRNGSMWIGSAPHPAHTGYDGTSRTTHCAPGYTGPAPFDQCSPGASYSFTFDKVGTWPYHDHMNSSSFGKVVVVE